MSDGELLVEEESSTLRTTMEPIRHIAIIPDGNRRWAKQRNKPEHAGHEEGARTGEVVLESALEAGVSYLTFWGLSYDNLQKRSALELKLLFALFSLQFEKLLSGETIARYDIRVRFIGQWKTQFPTSLVSVMERLAEETAFRSTHHLTFLMAYNGYEEMLQGIRSLPAGKPVERAILKDQLWTRDLPPVDLVVRTGGEPHLSNGFMMWDIGDAYLHFTETLWPDFSPEEFRNVIKIFSERERRFGK